MFGQHENLRLRLIRVCPSTFPLERDGEHAYEYLDGRVYMMTGGSPDHSIIGSNLNGLLQAFLHGRRCIVYASDVYVQLSDSIVSVPLGWGVAISAIEERKTSSAIPLWWQKSSLPPPKRAIAARSPCSIAPARACKNTCGSVLEEANE